MPRFVELEFSGESLDDLAEDLRVSALRFREEVDKTVVKVGEEVGEEAKALARRHSKKVADSIRTIPTPGQVAIRAGEGVPLAALYELGNKGRGGRKSETFSHPVFGNRKVWVKQKRHPFLAPALAANRRHITKMMESAWQQALEPLLAGGDGEE